MSIYSTTKCPGIIMMIINCPESPKRYHEHEHEHEQPAKPVSPSYIKNMYSSDTTLIPEGDRKEDLRG